MAKDHAAKLKAAIEAEVRRRHEAGEASPAHLLGGEITVDGVRWKIKGIRYGDPTAGCVFYDCQPQHGIGISVVDPEGPDSGPQKAKTFAGLI